MPDPLTLILNLTSDQLQILKNALDIEVDILSDSVTDNLSTTQAISPTELKERKLLVEDKIKGLMDAVRLQERLRHLP